MSDEAPALTAELPPAQPLTRDALYKLVWAEPMLKVASRFEVSSSYLARVCALLNVPRPERGYWAKLAVGKAPAIPALPEARPGDPCVWSRSGLPIEAPRALPKPPAVNGGPRRLRRMTLPDQHGLVAGAEEHFQKGRTSYEVGYLKPYKRLLVDVVASKTGIVKALDFANRLFLALESNNHRVVIAPEGERLGRAKVDHRETQAGYDGYNEIWSPARPTVTYIGTVAIGLTIIEMSEHVTARHVDGQYIRESEYVPQKRGRYSADRTWTTQRSFPSGRLCLQAYSRYATATWVRQWRDTKGNDLTARITAITRELEQSTPKLARLVEEGEREAELERQRWQAQQAQWEREEAERKAARARKESIEELLQIVDRWGRSKRIEQFFAEAELHLPALSATDRSSLQERLALGRELVGDGDALAHFLSWRAPAER